MVKESRCSLERTKSNERERILVLDLVSIVAKCVWEIAIGSEPALSENIRAVYLVTLAIDFFIG